MLALAVLDICSLSLSFVGLIHFNFAPFGASVHGFVLSCFFYVFWWMNGNVFPTVLYTEALGIWVSWWRILLPDFCRLSWDFIVTVLLYGAFYRFQFCVWRRTSDNLSFALLCLLAFNWIILHFLFLVSLYLPSWLVFSCRSFVWL